MLAKGHPSRMPKPQTKALADRPRWSRYLVVAGIVGILLSIPWATRMVLQNLRESEETLEALSKPDALRSTLERLDRSMSDAGMAVLHHAATVDRRDRLAYWAQRKESDSLMQVLEQQVQNEAERPLVVDTALPSGVQSAWLEELDSLRSLKFALLYEWVRFARTRDSVNTDNLDALVMEARKLTQDSLLDVDAKRIKKKEYGEVLAQADSLRDVRLAKLAEIQSQLEGVPKAVVALTEARQRKAARLARRDVELDLAIRSVLDRWFQYRANLEPSLVAQRQDNLDDWQRGLWVVAISASALLFALGLILTVLFRRTDRVQVALARTLEQERALVEAREAFLANMSHEIRTPLHAIGGFAERLSAAEKPEVREQAGLIREAGSHLLELVNHILDYARLRGQPGTPRSEAFSPKALLDGTAELLRIRAAEKELEITAEVGPDVPAALAGDRLRLRQILLNLGANAVKYTEHGQVRLHATGQAVSGERFRLVLEVEDTGPGISAAQKARIFEPFRQLQGHAQSDATEGLGLGLAIVAELCAQMDATVDLDSTPGRGSLFRVSLVLPLANAEALAEQRTPEMPAQPIGTPSRTVRILAADDEAFNRKLLDAQMRDHPWAKAGVLAYQAFEGGTAAWAHVESSTEAPDLLLLDWRMPDMDGVALLQRVRGTHPGVKAVALTAQADSQAQQTLMEAGFDAVLEKPFGRDALYATLSGLLDHMSTDEDITEASPVDARDASNGQEHGPPGQQDGPAQHTDFQEPASPDGNGAADAETTADPGQLDLADLEALADGDGTFVADMLEIFLQRLEATRQTWDEAVANKDRKAIAESAHKLAAPARQLGFSALAAALRALEEDADGEASIAALANRCRRLQPMLQTAQLTVAAKLEEGSQTE